MSVKGDVGDVARDDRKVCAAGDSAGLDRRFGRVARKPGSRDGSRGKRRCRVNDPVAIHQLPPYMSQARVSVPLVPAIIAKAAEASFNTLSISFHP